MWSVAPELLREIRFWGSSTCPSLPWLLLAAILICCCSYVCGALSAAILFSASCRRILGYILRWVANFLDIPALGPQLAQGQLQRLREYRA